MNKLLALIAVMILAFSCAKDENKQKENEHRSIAYKYNIGDIVVHKLSKDTMIVSDADLNLYSRDYLILRKQNLDTVKVTAGEVEKIN